jgi:hypothetical protein
VKELADPRSREFRHLHDYRLLVQAVRIRQCDLIQLTDLSFIRVGSIFWNSALGGNRSLTLWHDKTEALSLECNNLDGTSDPLMAMLPGRRAHSLLLFGRDAGGAGRFTTRTGFRYAAMSTSERGFFWSLEIDSRDRHTSATIPQARNPTYLG